MFLQSSVEVTIEKLKKKRCVVERLLRRAKEAEQNVVEHLIFPFKNILVDGK